MTIYGLEPVELVKFVSIKACSKVATQSSDARIKVQSVHVTG